MNSKDLLSITRPFSSHQIPLGLYRRCPRLCLSPAHRLHRWALGENPGPSSSRKAGGYSNIRFWTTSPTSVESTPSELGIAGFTTTCRIWTLKELAVLFTGRSPRIWLTSSMEEASIRHSFRRFHLHRYSTFA